jgi:GNAT superfamily N-acetyltransferase
MAGEVRVVPVDSNARLAMFLDLPRQIYTEDPNWVPPFSLELKERLNPRKNPYFQHAEMRMWLAFRGHTPVGRISAQVDKLVDKHHHAAIGHIGFFEVENNVLASQALFNAAEEWLRKMGRTAVLGPYNPTINEEPGVLVSGYDAPPMMLMGHSPSYYAGLFEEAGYTKAKDLYAFHLDIRNEILPPTVKRMCERMMKAGKFTLRRVSMRRYREDLNVILTIFNDAWSDNWGYLPMTDAELKHTADSLKLLIREEYTYIAEAEGRPIGMMVTLPNLNEIVQRIDGKLWPFGIFRLLWWLKTKKETTVRVPLMGVLKEFQNTPLGGAVAMAMIEQIRQNGVANGVSHAELSWILEDNPRMIGILEQIGSRNYKTYRIYGKSLTA